MCRSLGAAEQLVCEKTQAGVNLGSSAWIRAINGDLGVPIGQLGWSSGCPRWCGRVRRCFVVELTLEG